MGKSTKRAQIQKFKENKHEQRTKLRRDLWHGSIHLGLGGEK